MKFNRQIGDYAGKRYSVEGAPLTEAEYSEHLAKVLPGPEEKKTLAPIFRSGNWMAAGSA
jgi:hypothetical protein